MIPKEVIKKLFLIDNGFSIWSSKDKIFIDKTGSTHGIAFNIKPPTKAINIIYNKLLSKYCKESRY